jgi:hypothetical protein
MHAFVLVVLIFTDLGLFVWDECLITVLSVKDELFEPQNFAVFSQTFEFCYIFAVKTNF